VSIFWAPAIFEHKSIIHGDFYGHSLPLMDMHSRALRDPGTLLWQDKTYGGHPMFAEGQGGFAHPVNMFFAWVIAPLFGVITAENLLHWFCMIFGGAGVLMICRQLGLSGGASFGSATYGQGVDPIWMDDVSCLGTEARLQDCPFPGWAVHNCSHGEDWGVSCSP